jgi:hypothetical protein
MAMTEKMDITPSTAESSRRYAFALFDNVASDIETLDLGCLIRTLNAALMRPGKLGDYYEALFTRLQDQLLDAIDFEKLDVILEEIGRRKEADAPEAL